MSFHCPHLPWLKVLQGCVGLRTKRAKVYAGEKRGMACSKESTPFFILKVSICFLKVGILGEVSGKDFNKISASHMFLSIC